MTQVLPAAQPPQLGSYPPQPPPRKSHILRNVLLALLVLFLVVGALIAFVGGDTEGDQSGRQEQTMDKTIPVEEGQAFSRDGVKVAAGWRLTPQYRPGTVAESVNALTIKDLRVTNTKDDGMVPPRAHTAMVTFWLYEGSHKIAQIGCGAKGLHEGDSAKMDCSEAVPPRPEAPPKGFDPLRVHFDGIRAEPGWWN